MQEGTPDEELAPVDTLLLHGDGDPRRRSSIIGLCMLERAPEWPALMATVERAARRVPRLRQRVVSPLLPISRPHWVADPDFELTYHLRHVRIPDPGGFAELMRLTEVAAMAPLDPGRPLWELTLVEGLRDPAAPGERAALLWKFSHALGDGVGVLKIALALLDAAPEPSGDQAEQIASRRAGGKSRAALLRDRLIELPADLTVDALRAGKWAATTGLRAAADPAQAANQVVDFTRSLGRLLTPPAAAPSPVLRGRGTKRRLLVHEVPLEALKRAGRQGGGTVNDAYLAGVLGAMRRYHESLGVYRRPAPDGRPRLRPPRIADGPRRGGR